MTLKGVVFFLIACTSYKYTFAMKGAEVNRTRYLEFVMKLMCTPSVIFPIWIKNSIGPCAWWDRDPTLDKRVDFSNSNFKWKKLLLHDERWVFHNKKPPFVSNIFDKRIHDVFDNFSRLYWYYKNTPGVFAVLENCNKIVVHPKAIRAFVPWYRNS